MPYHQSDLGNYSIIFRGKNRKTNTSIIKALALNGPMSLWDITKYVFSDSARSDKTTIGCPSTSQIKAYESTIVRAILGRLKKSQERSPGLESRGFVSLERIGESEKGTPTKFYGLTFKGIFAALLIPEVNTAPPKVIVKCNRLNPFLDFGYTLIRKGASSELVRTMIIEPQVAALREGLINLDLVKARKNFFDGWVLTMLGHFIAEQFWNQFRPGSRTLEDTSLKDLRILRQMVKRGGLHGVFNPFDIRKLVLKSHSFVAKYWPRGYRRDYSKDPQISEKLRICEEIYDALVPRTPSFEYGAKRNFSISCFKCKAKIRIRGSLPPPKKITCPSCGSVFRRHHFS